MGKESVDRATDPLEQRQIQALPREAVLARVLGITRTAIAQHIGYQIRPPACRQAGGGELSAYVNFLKDLGRSAMKHALTATARV